MACFLYRLIRIKILTTHTARTNPLMKSSDGLTGRTWEGWRREGTWFSLSPSSNSTLVTFSTLQSFTHEPSNPELPPPPRKGSEATEISAYQGEPQDFVVFYTTEKWILREAQVMARIYFFLIQHFTPTMLSFPALHYFRLVWEGPWIGLSESSWWLRFQNSLRTPPREKGWLSHELNKGSRSCDHKLIWILSLVSLGDTSRSVVLCSP